MAGRTSSAEPRQLYRYADVALRLDGELGAEASRLGATLHQFEATCREPGMALRVSYLADMMRGYARDNEPVENWVQSVGQAFERADRWWGSPLFCIIYICSYPPGPRVNIALYLPLRERFVFRTRGDSILGNASESILSKIYRAPPRFSSLLLWIQFARVRFALTQLAWNLRRLIFLYDVYLWFRPIFLLPVFPFPWFPRLPRPILPGGSHPFPVAPPRFGWDLLPWRIVLRSPNYVALLSRTIGTAVASLTGEKAVSTSPKLNDAQVMCQELLDISYDEIGRPATFQDLAAVIERMYRAAGDEESKDPAVQIVKVGENDWLVLVMGTDMDEYVQAPDALSNISTGKGVASTYQLYIERLMKDFIPKGATVHLAGHSQGGYVVMGLAGDQDLVDRYNFSSVTSLGTGTLPPKNPRIDPNIYHNFTLSNDPLLTIADKNVTRELTKIPLIGGMAAGFPGQLGGPHTNPTVVSGEGWDVYDPLGGHGQYHTSPELGKMQLPFSIDRWEPEDPFFAVYDTDNDKAIRDLDYYGLRYDKARPLWDGLTGKGDLTVPVVVDGVLHIGAVTGIAVLQDGTGAVTQYLPDDWQVEIDRAFDAMAEFEQTLPPASEMVSDAISGIQSVAVDAYRWGESVVQDVGKTVDDIELGIADTGNRIVDFFGF